MIDTSTARASGRHARIPVALAAALLASASSGEGTGESDRADAAAAPDAVPCGPRLHARFVESAPRDRFEFVNRSGDGTRVSGISLDLDGSVGRLVFDTLDGGSGVEVFQPFRVEEGAALLASAAPTEDGGQRVELAFEGFVAGERFAFSIDVDDRLTRSELGRIRVAGGEMAGASLTLRFEGPDGTRTTRTTTFGDDARARVDSGGSCPD